MSPIDRIRIGAEILARWMRPNIKAFTETGVARIWLLSLIIGTIVAIAAIIFREAIGLVQYWWLGSNSERTLTAARTVAWYWILAAPIVGGLVVGLMLERISARRAGNVADVIEARALTGRPLGLRDGLWSAAVSAISLGSGASAGREGPVIHLGATLASVVAIRQKIPEWCSRTLVASGVAAAISASFNAPIAGVLFAHEVILQHYGMRSFVPIVIASAVGSVISRLWFGDAATFVVPDYQIISYWEFPAFAILGIVCALVAIAFQFSLFSADYVARSVTMPLRYRPVVGGVMIGIAGVFFPHILGVGYEVTARALWNHLPLALMLGLIVLKMAATAITLASRFGGGIFSPSLYLGALTGAAFGLIAGSMFPGLASSEGLYAILGMGAVAGAVLGAPISTTVIVFELTGGYELSIALLLTVAIAHGINQALHGHSYFHWQLEMRGLFDHQGPHRQLMRTKKVMDFMELVPRDGDPQVHDPASDYPTLRPGDSLEVALRAFDKSGHGRLAVVDPAEPTRIIAWATQIKALSYFNKALIEASEEEHR